jgi:hypothetical protein
MDTSRVPRGNNHFISIIVSLAFLFSLVVPGFHTSAAANGEAGGQSQAASISPADRYSPPTILQGDHLSLTLNPANGQALLKVPLEAEDPSGVENLAWKILTPAQHGSASVTGSRGEATAVYRPDYGYSGSDVFAVQVSDLRGGTDFIAIEVMVLAAPPARLSSAGSMLQTFSEAAPTLLPDSFFPDSIVVPYIDVGLEGLWLFGYNWPLYNDLTLTVDDGANGEGVDFTQTKTVYPNPDNPAQTRVSFDWPSFGVDRGDIVTMSDGETAKTLIVALSVTSYDYTADTISGTSLPDRQVSVNVWSVDHYVCRYAIPDASGDWTVNFSYAGPSECSPSLADLVPGMSFWTSDIDDDGDMTRGSYTLPTPYFEVDKVYNSISGYGWSTGASVSLTIDDPANGAGTDYSDSADVVQDTENPSYGTFTFQVSGFTLATGQQVTIADGITTKEHTITSLTVMDADQAADTVSGTAEDGSYVFVGPLCSGLTCSSRIVSADNSGDWTADFSTTGPNPGEDHSYDISQWDSSYARQTDGDNDCTLVPWHVRNTYFDVYKSLGYIKGSDWRPGRTATLTIDDPGNGPGTDYSDTLQVQPAAWDADYGIFKFDMDGFTLQGGQQVTITDGITTKTHTITSLAVTGIDTAADTISGTAAAGSQVEVGWLCDSYTCTHRLVTANGSGLWTANYSISGPNPGESGTIDIVKGASSTAFQVDADNDTTRVSWHVLDPIFEVYRDSSLVKGWDWPVGATVTLTIDDPGISGTVNYTDTAGVAASSSDPTYGAFSLDITGFTLQAGQVVTVTDGSTTKVHTITSLAVTVIDPNADTVRGTAAPGSPVGAGWLCVSSLCTTRRVSADGLGYWTADFSTTGSDPDEAFTYDIVLGDSATAFQQDSDRDATMVDWHVAPPTFSDVPYDYSVSYGGTMYYLHHYIQALYDAGLTAGCGTNPLRYCPNNTLTRVESAVFMLRGAQGASYTPPTDPAGYVFVDNWSSPTISWGRPWAEGMWDEGMTAGCSSNPRMFCPTNALTRAEAAVFGLHIEYGMSYTPPTATHVLGDDWSSPSISWAEPWAERAYLDGLLPPCGVSGDKPLFCPSDLVTRAWAAYLVVQAKDLP